MSGLLVKEVGVYLPDMCAVRTRHSEQSGIAKRPPPRRQGANLRGLREDDKNRQVTGQDREAPSAVQVRGTWWGTWQSRRPPPPEGDGGIGGEAPASHRQPTCRMVQVRGSSPTGQSRSRSHVPTHGQAATARSRRSTFVGAHPQQHPPQHQRDNEPDHDVSITSPEIAILVGVFPAGPAGPLAPASPFGPAGPGSPLSPFGPAGPRAPEPP